jgi:hypothetical protein
MYKRRYGRALTLRGFSEMTSADQETLMRCNIEATALKVTEIDDLVVLAQCIDIRKKLRQSNN